MTKDLESDFPVPAEALSPASVPAAEVRDMRFRWPGGRFDLRVDSFKVEAGERVFISGPSGCGKSTFLSLVAGILVPDSGEVLLAGRSLKGLRGSRRDRLRGDLIGFIFQQFNLVPYLGVLENVLLPAKFSPLRNARAAEAYGSPAAAAGELCRRLGLDDGVMGRPVSRLSVGQQQRVAAARALLGRPPLLVADEPTSSLDDDLRLAFLKLLAGECRQAGSALLFVSHDRSLAGEFDREERLDKLNTGCIF